MVMTDGVRFTAWWSFEPDERFERAGPRSHKVRCRICGAIGHPVDIEAGSWMETHRRDHFPCPDCGKQLVCYPNGLPRKHSRCPNRKR